MKIFITFLTIAALAFAFTVTFAKGKPGGGGGKPPIASPTAPFIP